MWMRGQACMLPCKMMKLLLETSFFSLYVTCQAVRKKHWLQKDCFISQMLQLHMEESGNNVSHPKAVWPGRGTCTAQKYSKQTRWSDLLTSWIRLCLIERSQSHWFEIFFSAKWNLTTYANTCGWKHVNNSCKYTDPSIRLWPYPQLMWNESLFRLGLKSVGYSEQTLLALVWWIILKCVKLHNTLTQCLWISFLDFISAIPLMASRLVRKTRRTFSPIFINLHWCLLVIWLMARSFLLL